MSTNIPAGYSGLGPVSEAEFGSRPELKKLPSLLAMSGLPRSGKSTICREVYLPMGYTIVCPDDFRLAIHGTRYSAEAEHFVWAAVYAAVDALLLSGNKVILDATNMRIVRREPWVKRGARFVLVETPKEECIRRAMATNDTYIVPVIERMALTAEPIEEWEGIVIEGTRP
jgi:predicted kinase